MGARCRRAARRWRDESAPPSGTGAATAAATSGLRLRSVVAAARAALAGAPAPPDRPVHVGS
jgi:hypothetical protein